MAYVLHATLGRPETLDALLRRWAGSTQVVELPQHVGLVPVTEAVRAQYSWIAECGEPRSSFAFGNEPFPDPLSYELALVSSSGPIAYVEAEFFGGDGEQFAVVWDRGEIVLGPVVAPTESDGPEARRNLRSHAINQALRRLGVVKGGAAIDEFDTVGLGLFRDTEDWGPSRGEA